MVMTVTSLADAGQRSLSAPIESEKYNNPHRQQSLWHRLGIRKLLGLSDSRSRSRSSFAGRKVWNSSDGENDCCINGNNSNTNNHNNNNNNNNNNKNDSNLTRRFSRKVNMSLPRAKSSEPERERRRDRLSPVHPEIRRAASADRHNPTSVDPNLSVPEGQWVSHLQTMVEDAHVPEECHDVDQSDILRPPGPGPEPEPEPEPLKEEDIGTGKEEAQRDGDEEDYQEQEEEEEEEEEHEEENKTVEVELDKKWILNLSMHFRDRSEREKFFITYAETPSRWRRVTVSCDYRNALPESLEEDLKELRYQRDKSARIYDSIRESLSEIQFYDTVTNLKLETKDGRLHVHVTEDVNEIIPYPPVSCVRHLSGAPLIQESRLTFDAHLSGFVYKVQLDGRDLVKKEIPSPDTVDEFFYEINALHVLSHSSNVVHFEGIVVDDKRRVVKGLLISYASRGALVDILYEQRGQISWERRERWARQIVHGLCEIHEAGYVQGDFTLSNIVVDEHDNAKSMFNPFHHNCISLRLTFSSFLSSH